MLDFFFQSSLAALNNYSKYKNYGIWTIERKYNSKKDKYFCRASIFKEGSWFSSRTRINSMGKLIITKEYLNKRFLNEESLSEIRNALKECEINIIEAK
tara:strand:- start:182 stop:478 length:297 start_codon:yes stop_codon:yes gene_type:complete